MKIVMSIIFVASVALTSAFHIAQKETKFDPSKGPEQLVDLKKERK